MRRATNFWTKAIVGYTAVALLLAGGMALSIQRLDAVATAQVARIRVEENEITLVERLRWSGELTVSIGRGYLISGDASLLTKLQEAEADFDRSVHELKSRPLTPSGALLLAAVEQAATEFKRVQEQLLAARQRSEDINEIIRRFETQLLSFRRELRHSLDRLVDHKEAVIKNVYDEASRDRARLTLLMYAFLGVLFLMSLGVAWYFARWLARSYRKEQGALEAARNAVAARDELLGVVAHDLRNPLGAIMMRAVLLRKRAESEEVRKHAEAIENVSNRMGYLIGTMLDVATLEAGQFSVSRATCDVDDLLSEVTDLFGVLSASKQIRLERSVVGSQLTIRADRERMIQVLSNLVGNAVKFTSEGGRVAVSVDQQRDAVCFAVSDTGPGIASEDLPHLFSRFWKHEVRGKKGTGLGLFIAKGIIDAHGGQLWVQSAPGCGTTFYFTLPIDESDGVAGLPAETRHFPLENVTSTLPI